jgi:hypothetical protein
VEIEDNKLLTPPNKKMMSGNFSLLKKETVNTFA